MLNQVVVVGRVNEEIKKEDEIYYLTIVTQRSFKNSEGNYDYDVVDCRLAKGVGENAVGYLKKGDLVGIKGRLQRNSSDDKLEIVAEKLTFLSSRKED